MSGGNIHEAVKKEPAKALDKVPFRIKRNSCSVTVTVEVQSQNFASDRQCGALGALAPSQNGIHLLGDEALHLLRTAADVGGGIQMGSDLLPGHAKAGVGADAVDQIVGQTLLLDPLPGGHGVLPDDLVQLLPIAAPLDGFHHDVLTGHEG